MAHIIQNRWALESRFLLLLASRNLVGHFNCHFFFPTDVMAGYIYIFHYNNNEGTLALVGLSLSHLLHHALNTNLTPPPSSPPKISYSYILYTIISSCCPPSPCASCVMLRLALLLCKTSLQENLKPLHNHFITFSNRLPI